MKKCEFEITPTSRIECKVHKQTLMYMYANGLILCQVGEDELITELGGIDKFHALLLKGFEEPSGRCR